MNPVVSEVSTNPVSTNPVSTNPVSVKSNNLFGSAKGLLNKASIGVASLIAGVGLLSQESEAAVFISQGLDPSDPVALEGGTTFGNGFSLQSSLPFATVGNVTDFNALGIGVEDIEQIDEITFSSASVFFGIDTFGSDNFDVTELNEVLVVLRNKNGEFVNLLPINVSDLTNLDGTPLLTTSSGPNTVFSSVIANDSSGRAITPFKAVVSGTALQDLKNGMIELVEAGLPVAMGLVYDYERNTQLNTFTSGGIVTQNDPNGTLLAFGQSIPGRSSAFRYEFSYNASNIPEPQSTLLAFVASGITMMRRKRAA